MCNRKELVFVPGEKVFGYIVGGLQAHLTLVRYIKGGIEYEVFLDNNEFEIMEEGPIGYEDE